MSRSRRWRSCALNYMFIFTITERSRQVFRQQSRQQPSSSRQDPVSVKLTSSSDLPSSQQASQPGPLLAPAVPRSAAKLPVMHLPCDVHRLPPCLHLPYSHSSLTLYSSLPQSDRGGDPGFSDRRRWLRAVGTEFCFPSWTCLQTASMES